MKQQTLAMASGFERYTKKTRRTLFLEEMEQVVPWAELCALIEPVYAEGGQRAAAGGGGADAADLFFAAVVQPVGPGGGRSAVRFGGDAAVCGHRSGAGAGAGRDHGVQVPPSAGAARVGESGCSSGWASTCSRRDCASARERSWMRRLSTLRVRPRTRGRSGIRRCTRRARASSGTSG